MLAAVQLVSTDMYVELGVTLGCAVLLAVSMFFCMPLKLAKATLFLFLTNTASVSFGGAMQYWYTVDDACNKAGAYEYRTEPVYRK